MKRILVLLLSLVLLVTVIAATVSADPVHVGGDRSFTGHSGPIHVGGGLTTSSTPVHVGGD